MVELSRRWFLSGAISLAAVTIVPAKLTSNKPRIWADGQHDDAEGIGALLRNESCVIPAEAIEITDHSGFTIHYGRYLIGNEVHILRGAAFDIERAEFRGDKLDINMAFFSFDDPNLALRFMNNREISWTDMRVLRDAKATGIRYRPVILRHAGVPQEQQRLA